MTFIEDEVDTKRLSEIISIFFKHELGFVIKKLDLKEMLPLNLRLEKNVFEPKKVQPYIIRKCLEEAGIGFVKLGQFLSLRPDIIPIAYAQEFSNIKDGLEEIPFTDVLKIIESELKEPVRTILSDIHEKPIASDSISQSHEAMLRTGKSVIIKVQKPNLEEVFKKDIKIMYYLAKLISLKYELKILDTERLMQEFENWMKRQLDFLEEQKNFERFYHNSIDDLSLKIPNIYWEHTTNKLIITEKIEAKSISEVMKLKNHDKNDISKKLTDSLLKQILIYYFFNPDIHEKNVFFDDNKVIFVEAKTAGLIEDRVKKSTQRILAGIIERNPNMILECMINLNTNPNKIDRVLLIKDIGKELDYNSDVNSIDIIEIMKKMLLLSKKYEIKLPLDFVLVIKALLNLRDLNEKLGSKISIVQEIVNIFAEKENRRNLNKEFIDTIKGDNYRIKIFIEKHKRSIDRNLPAVIAFILIIAGLFSIRINGFKIFGINIVSFILFVIALIFAGFFMHKGSKERNTAK